MAAFANRLGSSAAALLFASRTGYMALYGLPMSRSLLWGCLCATLQRSARAVLAASNSEAVKQ